jgi:hypothetical protein
VLEPKEVHVLLLAVTRSRPVELLLVAGYLLTAAAVGRVIRERRRGRELVAATPAEAPPSAAELEGVPGRNGKEFEERPPASGVAVSEVGGGVVPADLEQALLDAVIQPRAPEDELGEPVDEGLAVEDREAFPVTDEVDAESASRFLDAPVGRELDEIRGLVDVELVSWDETELDGRGRHALLEVEGAEREPVPEVLDDVVVAGGVVGLGHEIEDNPPLQLSQRTAKRIALSVLGASLLLLVGAALLRIPASMALLLAPVALALAGALVALLAIRSRGRAAGP